MTLHRLCLALFFVAASLSNAAEQWIVESVSAPGKAHVHYNEGEEKLPLRVRRIVTAGAILTFEPGVTAKLRKIGQSDLIDVPNASSPTLHMIEGRKDLVFVKSLKSGFVNAATKRSLGNNRLLSPASGTVLLPAAPLRLRWTPTHPGQKVQIRIGPKDNPVWQGTISGEAGVAVIDELPDRLQSFAKAATSPSQLRVECSALLENEAPTGPVNVCTVASPEVQQKLAAQLAEFETVARPGDRSFLRAAIYQKFGLPDHALREFEGVLADPGLSRVADIQALGSSIAELAGQIELAKKMRAEFERLALP